jgi:hypothetical protein
MSIENFQDPRGEYKRVCPYCLEHFTVTHMNRYYCPEKNSKKDFCKSRFKRLVKELKESGIEIDRPKRPPLKLFLESVEKNFRNIDEGIKKALLNRKIKILEKVLGESDSKNITWDKLENLGFTLDSYDKFTINEYGTRSPTFDFIQLIWLDENELIIKKLKK